TEARRTERGDDLGRLAKDDLSIFDPVLQTFVVGILRPHVEMRVDVVAKRLDSCEHGVGYPRERLVGGVVECIDVLYLVVDERAERLARYLAACMLQASERSHAGEIVEALCGIR